MRIIGGLIGGLLVLALFLGPALGLYYVSKDTLASLSYEGTEEAVITDCESIRLSGSSPRYRRVPVAVTESGRRVRGTVDEVRFLWECDDQIGKPVEVTFDLQNASAATINSFHQMWFLPMVLATVCLVLYPAMIKGYVKKYRRWRQNQGG